MKKIKLTQGKCALVDDDDFEEINSHKWKRMENCIRSYDMKKICYATTLSKRKNVPKFGIYARSSEDAINAIKYILKLEGKIAAIDPNAIVLSELKELK